MPEDDGQCLLGLPSTDLGCGHALRVTPLPKMLRSHFLCLLPASSRPGAARALPPPPLVPFSLGLAALGPNENTLPPVPPSPATRSKREGGGGGPAAYIVKPGDAPTKGGLSDDAAGRDRKREGTDYTVAGLLASRGSRLLAWPAGDTPTQAQATAPPPLVYSLCEKREEGTSRSSGSTADRAPKRTTTRPRSSLVAVASPIMCCPFFLSSVQGNPRARVYSVIRDDHHVLAPPSGPGGCSMCFHFSIKNLFVKWCSCVTPPSPPLPQKNSRLGAACRWDEEPARRGLRRWGPGATSL